MKPPSNASEDGGGMIRNLFRKTFVVIILLASAFTTVAQDGPCSGVCSDGSKVNVPDRAIKIAAPYSFIDTCGALDAIIPAALQAASEECKVIKQVGSYCGCPVNESACRICDEGTKLVNGALEIDFEPIQTDLIATTCGFAEAYLHSLEETSNECSIHKEQLSSSCLCTASNSTIEDTDGDGQDDVGCSLCAFGDDAPFATKDISYVIDAAIPPEYAGLLDAARSRNQSITCSFVEGVLGSLLSDSDGTCNGIRSLLGPLCGCPSQANEPCGFCGATPYLHDPVLYPDYLVQSSRMAGFPAVRCEDIRLYVSHSEVDSAFCGASRNYQHLCGCNDGHRNYLGATTQKRRMWLAWMPRISGLLSIFGSIWILADVGRHYRQGTMFVFHQLIGAIAFCDIFSSSGWVLSTLMQPEYNSFGEPDAIYGAKGNQATCAFQGFLIQFGFGAVLYHISLSTYYLLVVRQGWPENRVKKMAIWLHTPMIVGLALALSGIPFYDNGIIVCYILAPPQVEGYRDATIFAFVPFFVSAAIATCNMMLVYFHVRKQAKAGDRWRIEKETKRRQGSVDASLEIGQNRPPRRSARAKEPSLLQKVFWQNVFYLGSFYLSWSFTASSQLVEGGGGYGYWLTFVALAPLQGFVNFLIYIRPRAATKYRAWIRKRSNREATPSRLRVWIQNRRQPAAEQDPPELSNRVQADASSNLETAVQSSEMGFVPKKNFYSTPSNATTLPAKIETANTNAGKDIDVEG